VNRRRSVDFYPEGDLVWLEVDTIIRQQTKGKSRSMISAKNFTAAKTVRRKSFHTIMTTW